MDATEPRDDGRKLSAAVCRWMIGVPLFGLLGCCCLGGISWVFPMGNQKWQGKRTATLSNMKQLGTALQIYAADYDDRFPAPEDWGTRISALVRDEWTFKDLTFDPPPYKYGFALHDPVAFKNAELIDSPGRVPLVIQTDYRDLNAHGSLSILPAKPRAGEGKDIFCFVDTSVKITFRTEVEPRVRLNSRPAP
jgi:hypothetical protein